MGSETISDYIEPELYDAIYSWYREDPAFYLETARAAGGPVLEVGCGTGRLLIPTLEAGAEIDGIDLSPGMLEVLRRKAAARGLQARVAVGDMRDFTMPRRYALITIPFRTFLHNLTAEDQIATLRCCREHLEPGGALVLNLFHLDFARVIARKKEERTLERELVHPESGLPMKIFSRHRYDRVNQILDADKEIQVLDEHGAVASTHAHRFRLRWIYKAEMELLLRLAGFNRWQVWGGFDRRPLARDTDEMVWTAWKD